MRFLAAVAVFSILALAPVAVSAANLPLFNPDFRIVPDPHEYDPSCPVGAPLSFGAVMQTVQNLMNVAISVGVLVMIFAIVVTGFQLVMSATNPRGKEEARKRFGSVFIGFLVVISAWLVVDFIMKTLYDPETNDGRRWGPWNEIITADSDDWCIKQGTTTPIINAALIGVLTGRSGPGAVGGGSCTAPSRGPCSVASLQSSCFASTGAVEQAARICNKESGGNPLTRSRTDITADGLPYSVGLFQINLTNSYSIQVNGKNCSEAFSVPCQGSNVQQSGRNIGRCVARVTDRALYDACVTSASNVTNNLQQACDLYDGDWGRWSYSAGQCGLPR